MKAQTGFGVQQVEAVEVDVTHATDGRGIGVQIGELVGASYAKAHAIVVTRRIRQDDVAIEIVIAEVRGHRLPAHGECRECRNCCCACSFPTL